MNWAVHWIGYYNGSLQNSVQRSIVAVFDLDHEVFKEFQLPGGLINHANELEDDRMQLICVGVINKSLALLHCYSRRCPDSFSFPRCCIWVMKDYGATESWTLLFDLQTSVDVDVGRILGPRRHGYI